MRRPAAMMIISLIQELRNWWVLCSSLMCLAARRMTIVLLTAKSRLEYRARPTWTLIVWARSIWPISIQWATMIKMLTAKKRTVARIA